MAYYLPIYYYFIWFLLNSYIKYSSIKYNMLNYDRIIKQFIYAIIFSKIKITILNKIF